MSKSNLKQPTGSERGQFLKQKYQPSDSTDRVFTWGFTMDEINAIWVSLQARIMYLKDHGDDYGRLPRYEATLANMKKLMDEAHNGSN